MEELTWRDDGIGSDDPSDIDQHLMLQSRSGF
jgi:hypothetical protein